MLEHIWTPWELKAGSDFCFWSWIWPSGRSASSPSAKHNLIAIYTYRLKGGAPDKVGDNLSTLQLCFQFPGTFCIYNRGIFLTRLAIPTIDTDQQSYYEFLAHSSFFHSSLGSRAFEQSFEDHKRYQSFRPKSSVAHRGKKKSKAENSVVNYEIAYIERNLTSREPGRAASIGPSPGCQRTSFVSNSLYSRYS